MENHMLRAGPNAGCGAREVVDIMARADVRLNPRRCSFRLAGYVAEALEDE